MHKLGMAKVGTILIPAVIFSGLVLLCDVSESHAHCGRIPPIVTLKVSGDTLSTEKDCFTGLAYCLTYSFYQSALKQELTDQFNANKYSALGYVDSVYRYKIAETTFYADTFYVDTAQGEDVSVSIVAQLKGPAMPQHLFFHETVAYWSPGSSQTSFEALVDTPFIAFFNTYDYMNEMGIGPLDGCYFEPSVYFVFPKGIVVKGDSRRMPGISVPFPTFANSVGLNPSTAVPPIRPGFRGVNIHYDGSRLNFTRNPTQWAIYYPFTADLFDLQGHRIFRRRVGTLDNHFSVDMPGRSNGIYFLRVQDSLGKSWTRSTRVILNGKDGASEKVNFIH